MKKTCHANLDKNAYPLSIRSNCPRLPPAEASPSDLRELPVAYMRIFHVKVHRKGIVTCMYARALLCCTFDKLSISRVSCDHKIDELQKPTLDIHRRKYQAFTVPGPLSFAPLHSSTSQGTRHLCRAPKHQEQKRPLDSERDDRWMSQRQQQVDVVIHPKKGPIHRQVSLRQRCQSSLHSFINGLSAPNRKISFIR